jgi:hypothetical protein
VGTVEGGRGFRVRGHFIPMAQVGFWGVGRGGGSAGLGAWLDHASARLNGLARLFRAGLALAGHSCQAMGRIGPCHA